MQTKRVRLAVAIGPSGEWAAAGGSYYRDIDYGPGDPMNQTADQQLAGGAMLGIERERRASAHVVYVEVDVPLPEPATVQGRIVRAWSAA